jgi:hypothetical protein
MPTLPAAAGSQMSQEPNPCEAPQADLPLQRQRPLIGKARRGIGIIISAIGIVTFIHDAPLALALRAYHPLWYGALIISAGSWVAFGARVGLWAFAVLALCVVAAIIAFG